MHKISPLVGPLRATPPIIGSEEERARREYTVQMSKRALIDLCQQEASKFLVQGRYDLAVPGAIQVINGAVVHAVYAYVYTVRRCVTNEGNKLQISFREAASLAVHFSRVLQYSEYSTTAVTTQTSFT